MVKLGISDAAVWMNVLWTFCSVSVALIEACPSECECSDTKVNCQYKFLDRVPKNIPPNTTELLLDGNIITSITKQDFHGLNDLYSLTLTSNKISYIGLGTFDKMNLTMLQMNDNNVSIIHKSMFQNLSNLFYLRLNHVSKTSPLCIEEGAFQNLRKLQQLYLAQNQMKQLHNNTFQGLENLQILDLSKNNFEVFQKSAFRYFGDFTKITLTVPADQQLSPCCCLSKASITSAVVGIDFRCNNTDGVGDIKTQQCTNEGVCAEGNVCKSKFTIVSSPSVKILSSTSMLSKTSTTFPTISMAAKSMVTSSTHPSSSILVSLTSSILRKVEASFSLTPLDVETSSSIQAIPSISIHFTNNVLCSASCSNSCQGCTTPTVAESKSDEERLEMWVIALIVVASLVVICLFLGLIFVKTKKNNGRKFSPKTHAELPMEGVNNAGYKVDDGK